MRKPGTLDFLIEHRLIQFVIGCVLLTGSVIGVMTWQPDPPELPYATFTGAFGMPIYIAGAVLGFVMAAWAWWWAYRSARL